MKSFLFQFTILASFILPIVIFSVSSHLTISLEGQGRFVVTNPAGKQLGAQDTNIYEEIALSTIPPTDNQDSTYTNGRDPHDLPEEVDTPEEPETLDETGDDWDIVDSDWGGR